jgi:hypothetical protein
VGRLSLAIHDDRRVLIRFAPHDSMGPGTLAAHLGILGFDLTTDVGGGENRSRSLEEDFVILGYRSSGQTSSKPAAVGCTNLGSCPLCVFGQPLT